MHYGCQSCKITKECNTSMKYEMDVDVHMLYYIHTCVSGTGNIQQNKL